MGKRLIILAVVLVVIIGGLIVIKSHSSKNPSEPAKGTSLEDNSSTSEENKPNDIKQEEESGDIIKINKIDDFASSKLLVESKSITSSELPSDIRYLASVYTRENMNLSSISAYYTKSNQSADAYDILHDYVLLFFDEVNDGSVKISASKEGNPLRDYHFNSAKEMSKIKGVDVLISQYEDKYIITFSQGRFQFDIETNGVAEFEMLTLVGNSIK